MLPDDPRPEQAAHRADKQEYATASFVVGAGVEVVVGVGVGVGVGAILPAALSSS